MDFLSEILHTFQLSGAVFYNAEFSSPWSFRSPGSKVLVPWISPKPGRVIVYHLVTAGKAWVCLENESCLTVEAGDIIVFPEGDPHLMGNGPRIEPTDNEKHLERIFRGGLEVARMGGGGEITKFVCGYLCCDPCLHRQLLSGLPRLLKVNIRNNAAGGWIENSLMFSVAQARSGSLGIEALLTKLSEALFIETLRQYAAEQPDAKMGWISGARNPNVGRALALLHREPSRDWSLKELAQEIGVSRSVLAARFQQYLGEPPMTYLTRWRLELGARTLATTNSSVAEVAVTAGYGSEAAFNRAFKREFGVPPARFRSQARGCGPGVLRPTS